MRRLATTVLFMILTSCAKPAPEDAALAVALHLPAHPRLAACVSIDGHDPSSGLIATLRKNGRDVFTASQCQKSGWNVLTPKGGQGEFVAYERFTRTSPWTGNLYMHAYSNGMHSDVYLFKLKLIRGTWIVTSEQEVSRA